MIFLWPFSASLLTPLPICSCAIFCNCPRVTHTALVLLLVCCGDLRRVSPSALSCIGLKHRHFTILSRCNRSLPSVRHSKGTVPSLPLGCLPRSFRLLLLLISPPPPCQSRIRLADLALSSLMGRQTCR